MARFRQFCELYWWRIWWITTIFVSSHFPFPLPFSVPTPAFCSCSRSHFPWIPVTHWDYKIPTLVWTAVGHWEDHGPVTVISKLGWLLSGAIDTMEARISHAYVVITGDPANPLQDDDILVDSLWRFWEVESFWIANPLSASPESTLFLPSLTFENDHYEVGLPWKNIQLGVPDHLSLRSLLHWL